MKILHLQTELKIACGITKTIYLLVKNTSGEISHSVFTLGGDAINRFNNEGIDVVVSAKSNRNLQQSLYVFLKIFFLVRKLNIDIIHSHHRYFDFIAFIISKIIKVKTITSVQSKVYGKKIFSYKADCLIVCSNSIKEHLVEYYKIDLSRITVIHNFVDPKVTVLTKQKSTLKKELGLDSSAIVIGFIGRFSVREKGVDILLESFKRLSLDCTHALLLLIGNGEDLTFINNFIKKNNLKAFVLPPKENIFDYFNIIDIVVLPSRVDPFPLVMLESGLMKKALIGSNVDGIKELIVNGQDGFIFPRENEESLSKSIVTLIKNPDLRNKLGEALFAKVISSFTSDKIIPVYMQTYQQLMKDDRKSFENF